MRNASGRRMGNAFQVYKFDSAKIDGKYIAICRICNKKLQNTAAARLKGHRNICRPTESSGTMDTFNMKEEDNLRKLSIELKTELIDNSDDSMYNDTQISSLNNHSYVHEPTNKNHNTQNHIYEARNQNYVLNNPLSPENNQRSFASDIDDIEEDDSPKPNIRLRKCSPKNIISVNTNKYINLQDERIKAETIYFRKKATYFQKQTENLKIQRTLMLLQSQKLRLEIEKIRNEY